MQNPGGFIFTQKVTQVRFFVLKAVGSKLMSELKSVI